ncbi:MAG: UBA/TS-N domain protein [Lachnospiraceae bacterium]|nr:UBA/TS-N domain protein [Lachnospiraceae bacterium]
MDNLEKVEKIREKSGVSYEEAKEALEACNYDLLDAVIHLEQQGKVPKPDVEVFTTKNDYEEQSGEFERAQKNYQDSCKKGNTIGDMVNSFFKFCGDLFQKSMDVMFCVTNKRGERVMRIPVLALILAFILAFWLVILLLLIGLFTGCRFQFENVEEIRVNVNDVCNKASDTCDKVKQSFSEKN